MSEFLCFLLYIVHIYKFKFLSYLLNLFKHNKQHLSTFDNIAMKDDEQNLKGQYYDRIPVHNFRADICQLEGRIRMIHSIDDL